MAQNFLIIIAHLRHALCALLAQADTMTAAAAGKYEFSIRNGADAHVVNRIGSIIGILRRLCCIHINGKLFPIQIGKRATAESRPPFALVLVPPVTVPPLPLIVNILLGSVPQAEEK